VARLISTNPKADYGFNRRSHTPNSFHKVDQITVPGSVLRRPDRQVMIITERGTFEFAARGLMLIEVIPGIDVMKDVVMQCALPVEIDPPLKIMPSRLVAEQ
jgi:acyl CoA:acetate/3-ketoacid CoA transferase